MGAKKSRTDKINTRESAHDQIMMSSFAVYKQNILKLAESER